MAEIEKVNDDVFIDEVEQEVKEEPITINVGDVFIDDKHYSERAKFCNENRGKLLEIKGTRENAKIIYLDRHVLDVIRWFNLTSYIPTYYENEGV